MKKEIEKGTLEAKEESSPEPKPLEYKKVRDEHYTADGKNFLREISEAEDGANGIRSKEVDKEEIRPGVWQKTGELWVEEPAIEGPHGEKQRMISYYDIIVDDRNQLGRRRISCIQEEKNGTWVNLPETETDMTTMEPPQRPPERKEL